MNTSVKSYQVLPKLIMLANFHVQPDNIGIKKLQILYICLIYMARITLR